MIIDSNSVEYRVTIGDVANLAIPLLRVPDAYRSKMPLPPSEHPRTAVALLLACTAAQDSSATLQIAAAVYHRDNSRIPGAKELARLLSSDEIKFAEGMMERLAEEGDATAMTLLGKFKERAGLEFEAISWYERAVEKCDTTFNPRYPHPSALPIESPWMALLMATERTPVEREKIKKALEKGALKAGDPLAYYHLATSEAEDGNDGRWLTYTTKAAASGIVEAAYDLGRYYKELSTGPADSIPDDQVKKMLKFALTWKSGSVQALAREWFTVAATAGHKPAMLELVGITTLEDDVEGAKAWLQRITESPPVNDNEKWPKLVERAKRMLAEPSLLAASTPSASPSRPPPASKNRGTVDPKKTGPVGKGEQPRKATVPGPAKRKPA
jgi:TPR repeat protein